MNCPRTSQPGSSQLPANVSPGVSKPAFCRKVYSMLSVFSDNTYCRFSSAALAKCDSASKRTALNGNGCMNGLPDSAALNTSDAKKSAVIRLFATGSRDMLKLGTAPQYFTCTRGRCPATSRICDAHNSPSLWQGHAGHCRLKPCRASESRLSRALT